MAVCGPSYPTEAGNGIGFSRLSIPLRVIEHGQYDCVFPAGHLPVGVYHLFVDGCYLVACQRIGIKIGYVLQGTDAPRGKQVIHVMMIVLAVIALNDERDVVA